MVLGKLDTIQHKAGKLLGKIGDMCPDLNLYNLEHHHTISGLTGVYQLLPLFMETARNFCYVGCSCHLQLPISQFKTEHHQKSFLSKLIRFEELHFE